MTTLLERARRGEPLTNAGIIDLHGHLGRVDFPRPDSTADAMVEVMDRVGIESVVVSHTRCLYDRPDFGNEEVLAAMQAHPGRILGYVVVHPRSAEWVATEMTRRVEQGFVGLKLHNANGFPYTDPAYEPAIGIANERRMPVLLHTWGDEACMSQVRALAQEFPEISLLLAHAGAANEEGYVQVAGEFENVYLDVCYSLGPRGLVERLVAGAGIDKVVFGTDGIFMSITQQIGKVLGARLSEEDKRKILSENARRILGRIKRKDKP